MANPTTNFGWVMPTSTDLVTDLPADFAVFGQAVDTSMADLKGGTTGQILSKATNTDMDFTWITNDVGDITSVVAGTGLTGGGTSGAVTLTFDEANYGGGQYAAGKNKIINGSFNVWQRGTTFTNPASGSYSADRYNISSDGSGRTSAISQQTFTPGTAPVAGYESAYFLRYAVTVAGTGASAEQIGQRIEDVRTFAGQSVTVSFWAKADSARSITAVVNQNFGSGGSALVYNAIGATSFTLTTSWVRYTMTGTMASVAGKTIGTSSFVDFGIQTPVNTTKTIDIWGVQFEQGSTATPFQTASGSIGGELALCRYYYRRTTADATALYELMAPLGYAPTVTDIYYPITFDTPMRATPSSVEYSTLRNSDGVNTPTVSSIVIVAVFSNKSGIMLQVGTTGSTVFRPYSLQGNNSASAFLGWSAEL